MQYFVIIGAATGFWASLLASHLALSRLLFFMSNDGLLSPYFSVYKNSSGTTPNATLTGCILSSVIAMCIETRTLFLWLGLGSLLSYMCVSIAILILRYGVEERLPLEHSELISRESSTFNDLRQASSPHRITRSLSDCYLNHHRCCHENQGDPGYGSTLSGSQYAELQRNFIAECESCALRNESFSSLKNSYQQKQSNGPSYGSIARSPRSLAVEFVNDSFVTSISNLSVENEKKLPTQKTAKNVAGNEKDSLKKRLSKTIHEQYPDIRLLFRFPRLLLINVHVHRYVCSRFLYLFFHRKELFLAKKRRFKS